MLITIVCAYAFIKLSGPTPQQWQGPDGKLGTFFPFPVLQGLHSLFCVLQQQFFPVVKSNSCHLSNHSRFQKNNLSVRQFAEQNCSLDWLRQRCQAQKHFVDWIWPMEHQLDHTKQCNSCLLRTYLFYSSLYKGRNAWLGKISFKWFGLIQKSVHGSTGARVRYLRKHVR